MSAVLTTFGLRLRSIRQSQGLSQEKLAMVAGLDRTYIGGVERGERNIALINIDKLASALSIEPYMLFTDLPINQHLPIQGSL